MWCHNNFVLIQEFFAASNRYGFATLSFDPPIYARFVRLQPTAFVDDNCFSFELFGCFLARDDRDRKFELYDCFLARDDRNRKFELYGCFLSRYDIS